MGTWLSTATRVHPESAWLTLAAVVCGVSLFSVPALINAAIRSVGIANPTYKAFLKRIILREGRGWATDSTNWKVPLETITGLAEVVVDRIELASTTCPTDIEVALLLVAHDLSTLQRLIKSKYNTKESHPYCELRTITRLRRYVVCLV